MAPDQHRRREARRIDGKRAELRRPLSTVAKQRVLRLPDDLAHVYTDECCGCVRHATKHVEGRLRCACVFFGVEEPERMLDEVATIKSPRPIAACRPCHRSEEHTSELQ